MNQLTITKPDDWHLHFRDGDMLAETVPATARCFQRAIVMPNLVPPVRTAAEALAYRERIRAARPEGSTFEPLMTLYLTDRTTPEDIAEAARCGVPAVKLYPAGATTNSDAAVTRLEALDPVLEALVRHDMLLLVHGEVTDAHVDIFDREKEFIDRTLRPLTERFAALRVVFEHITTKDAADFVRDAHENVAATITPQHLML
ncbi:MAG: amidohydrolase family protein, partial [Planctomycetota bacterium]